MICPECKSDTVYVVDTMSGEEKYVYRRRKCLSCGTKFHTVEQTIGDDEIHKKGYHDAYVAKTKDRYGKGK